MSALSRALNSLTNLRSDIALSLKAWNRPLFLKHNGHGTRSVPVFLFDGQKRKTNKMKCSNSIGSVSVTDAYYTFRD